MSLASRLPYDHPYAGGYPGIGSQPLPTDSDALDYLSRMATADGAGVETGVAVAVDAFVRDSKALGVWDSIRASCVLAGARTLAGALVPLKNEGPELVDIDNLPTPEISDLSGSAGEWDAATRTMSSPTVGGSVSYPRFRFYYADMPSGKQYAISGRLTGDVSHVNFVRAGASGDLAAINGDGTFSATLNASGAGGVVFIINGTLAPTSVTIESLSIREVIAAPTNVADGFVEGDFDRTAGLTGDGTSYIDSGRASDDDPQNDRHLSVLVTSATTNNRAFIGSIDRNATPTSANQLYWRLGPPHFLCNASSDNFVTTDDYSGNQAFVGVTRSSAGTQVARLGNNEYEGSQVSVSPSSLSNYVFARNDTDGSLDTSDATIAFYSIGTSLSLEDLDTAVTNLINRLKFALLVGENPSGLDPDTIDYIVRGYEAGGSLE